MNVPFAHSIKSHQSLRKLPNPGDSTIRGELDPDEDESVNESTPMRWAGQNKTDVSRRAHIIKAILYGIQNFYAFMIM